MTSHRTDLYRFFDANDVLLYIGISLNAAQRASQHRADKHWWAEVHRMEVEHLDCDRIAALAVERQAITDECPLYNVTHNTPITQPTPDNGPVAFDALDALGINEGVAMGWPYGRFDAAVLLNDIGKAINNLARNLGAMEHDVAKPPVTRQAFLDTLNAVARSAIYSIYCNHDGCRTPYERMVPVAIDIQDGWAQCRYICAGCLNESSCGWTTDLDALAML